VPDDLAARVNPYWRFLMTQGERIHDGEYIDAMESAKTIRKLAPSEEDKQALQNAEEQRR
jgi:hypothetical protein